MSGRTPRAQVGADRIVDAAMALAEESGWENVRLYLVAERLGVGLDEIGRQFRDLDAVANAWFARAREALLRLPPERLAGRPPERLHAALTTWFDALRPHHAVTVQMLRVKLYPSHPHHWLPLVFDLSRLMHDVLDAARIASTGRRRQLAEVGLTLIFLATLRDWLRRPEGAGARLRRRLAAAERLVGSLGESRTPRPLRRAAGER
ncbi:MAG TPA: TetR/AcrR family transcriptional regulator [Geminicoccaceae bacterium]|nr:TetR/AcrR family transcriptional regulator [Geminicoccaceae bacterium]